METMETYVESFKWHKENRMESPKIEKAEFANDLIIEWLEMADREIAELKEELRKLKETNQNGC